MQKIFPLLIFLIVSCKETGVHIIDNPNGTSVKVMYWDGNEEDHQPNLIKIGNRGRYLEVTHNANFMTAFDAELIFDLFLEVLLLRYSNLNIPAYCQHL